MGASRAKQNWLYRILMGLQGSNYGRAIFDGSWNSAQQVVSLLVKTTVSILIVRVLPVHEYGLYSYAIALATIGVSIMSAGLSGLAVKALVENPQEQNKTIATLLIVRGSFAFFGYILIAVYSLSAGTTNATPAVMIAALALLGRVIDAPQFWFLSRLRSSRTASVRIGVSLATLIIATLIIAVYPNLWLFLSLFALEAIVTGVLILWRYLHEHDSPGVSVPSYPQVSSLLSQSYPLMLSGVASQISLNGGVPIIEQIMDSTAVGVYSAATRVTEVAYFFPVVFMNSLFPLILRARQGNGADNSHYHRLIQRSYDVAFWLGVLISAGAFCAGYVLIRYVFGSGYEGAVSILAIQLLACPFVFMAAVYSKWIIAEGILWTSVLRHSLGAVVTIVLCLTLIPRYGLEGAAFASVSSHIVASYLSTFVGGRKNRQAGVAMTLALVAPIRFAFAQVEKRPA